MAVATRTLKDTAVNASGAGGKVTILVNWDDSAASNQNILDASDAEGAATDPRLSIVSCWWSVASQTDILWDATTNVVALSLTGNGKYNAGGQALPALPNTNASGATGVVLNTIGSASVGTFIVKFRIVPGFDNIT